MSAARPTRTYLDHAATTPMVPAAVAAMSEQLGRSGNPSSLHGSGRAARRVVEDARELIAEELGARPHEMIFTAGATEADNLALKGAFWARAAQGRDHVVCSAVEHHAVLDAAQWLGHQGAQTDTVPVDATGMIVVDELRSMITQRTAVLSVIMAINEVGTVQPLDQVVAIGHGQGVWVHTDATQAVGALGLDFGTSGLDLASLSAHKLGGPYGIGALLARREVTLSPLVHGGGQERDVRSGTLDVPAIAGFAAAVAQAGAQRVAEWRRLTELRHQLVAAILDADPTAIVYGPDDDGARLPGLVTVGFPDASAEAMLLLLDAAGVDASSGSACAAGVSRPSHVLLAMGVEPRAASEALRFSLGHDSTSADVQALAAVLPEAIGRARLAAAVA